LRERSLRFLSSEIILRNASSFRMLRSPDSEAKGLKWDEPLPARRTFKIPSTDSEIEGGKTAP